MSSKNFGVLKRLQTYCYTRYSIRQCSSHFQDDNKAKSDVVIVKKRGPIALIGLNRPEKKNALNFEIASRIDNALTEIEEEGSSKAIILYGERGNLCFGYDLEELQSDPQMIEKINSLGLMNRFSKIPLVAAVSGYAQGPGFELALWCDFRIVEESAVLGGFAKQLGVPLSEQSANKFVSILGFNKAIDWILTGRTVKGKEALESGIASRLVAIGTSLGQAFNFASGLANMPEGCLKADRASIYLASHKFPDSTREMLENERNSMIKLSYQEFEEKKYRQNEDGDVRKRSS